MSFFFSAVKPQACAFCIMSCTVEANGHRIHLLADAKPLHESKGETGILRPKFFF